MDVFSQFTPELDSAWNDAFSRDSNKFPFYIKQWHTQWLSSLSENEQPMIIADVPTHVLIPLAVKNGIAHFSGGEEISDYLDAIGPEQAKASLWRKALDVIAMQGAKLLVLRNIPQNSASLSFFSSHKGAMIEKEDTTPIVVLPGTFEEYLIGLDRKNRHELKRKVRKFEATHSPITITHATDMDLLLRLMKRDADKSHFLSDSMQRFFQNLPDTLDDTLTQFTLDVSGVVVATAVTFRTRDGLLLYNSGYNEAYVGAGFYLKAKMVEWAILNGITVFNFLQGDERYKYELGGKDFFVYKVTIKIP